MKITRIKNISLYQWTLGITIALIISLSGVLWADMNKRVDGKVDNKVLEQMIRVIEVEQKNAKEHQQEQKQILKENKSEQMAMNRKLLEAINALNKQIIIMNERTK